MKIKINDAETTARLEKIRQRLGGRARDEFSPVQANRRPIEGELDYPSLEKSVDPVTGLILQNGRPVFVYIKDHTVNFGTDWSPRSARVSFFGGIDSIDHDSDRRDPFRLRKLHFTFCSTLRKKEEEGQYKSRYHFTNRMDNLYPVNFGDGDEELRLYPCRNCLQKVNYDRYRGLSPENRTKVVQSFEAEAAMKKFGDISRSELQSKISDLKSDRAPVGYPSNWRVISKAVCERANNTCAECGAKGATHAHHKDHDKQNNRRSNLQCLCKRCHAAKHPHMRY